MDRRVSCRTRVTETPNCFREASETPSSSADQLHSKFNLGRKSLVKDEVSFSYFYVFRFLISERKTGSPYFLVRSERLIYSMGSFVGRITGRVSTGVTYNR